MANQNNDTVWITIPDEEAPALEAPVNTANEGSSNKVMNKAFWSAGFVALMIFSSALFAPQELVGLMKAQLFDGTFQVIPDFQDQGGTLFGEGEEGEDSAEGDEAVEDQSVVEAESDAVSIQIEPLTDTDTETPAEGETIVIDDLDVVHLAAGEEGEDQGETLDANAKLLQSLSQQLEEFKQKEQENEQRIQDLTQLLNNQALGIGQTGAQIGTQTVGQFGAGGLTSPANGVYRYNTHTVTVSPHDILAQNQGTQQASYQANLTYQGVQAYSNQSYNPVLAGVQGQPGTGPAESFLFAFAIASLGVLVWGSMRAIKA